VIETEHTVSRCATVCYNGDWFSVRSRPRKDGSSKYHCFKGLGNSFLPPVTETTFTSSPVLYVEDQLNGLDSDEWLSRAGDQLGLRNEVIMGIASQDENIVRAISFHSEIAEANKIPSILSSSLQPPLIALAELYRDLTKTPFILWQLEMSCSRLAVYDGVQISLCDFYAGFSECLANVQDSEITLALLLREEYRRFPLFLFPTSSDMNVDSITIPLGMKRSPLPQIPGIDQLYHEPYAILTRTVDLIPSMSDPEDFGTIEHISQGIRFFTAIRSGIVKIAMIAGSVVALWYGVIALSAYLGESKRKPLLPILKEISNQEAKRSSLVSQYGKLYHLIRQESQLTDFLNHFSTLFPKGSWAEHLEITDQGENAGWKIDLMVAAYAEQSVPAIVSSLEKQPGVSGIRVLYSERRNSNGRMLTSAKIELLYTPKLEVIYAEPHR